MIRIPVFDKKFLFNIGDEPKVVNNIINRKWVSEHWEPEFPMSTIQLGFDNIAKEELFRMLKFKTCPYCKTKMINISKYKKYGESFLICKNCLYWGGRGTRDNGPVLNRGILGRIDFLNNLEEARIEQVITFLNSNIEKIYELSPRQAEKLLPEILHDYLDCEVLALGGVKDKGIDALAIHGDNTKMIIQIKWRKNSNKAESVSVVREVGGTLLARKIPKGFIITTSKQFSSEAKSEAKLISKNTVLELGKLEIQLNDFNNIIDMFEIAAKKRTDCLVVEDFTAGWKEEDLYD